MSKHLFTRKLKVDDTDDTCPVTGKVSFTTAGDVMRANGRNTGSSYHCRHCGAYHFTTKADPAVPYVPVKPARERRHALGLSIVQAAEISGFDVKLISAIERDFHKGFKPSQKKRYVEWLSEKEKGSQ